MNRRELMKFLTIIVLILLIIIIILSHSDDIKSFINSDSENQSFEISV